MVECPLCGVETETRSMDGAIYRCKVCGFIFRVKEGTPIDTPTEKQRNEAIKYLKQLRTDFGLYSKSWKEELRKLM